MSTIVSFDAAKFASDGFEFKVNPEKSVAVPIVPASVTKTSYGWLFPEDVHIIADKKQEYLYAFGMYHVWRTKDVETWELIK